MTLFEELNEFIIDKEDDKIKNHRKLFHESALIKAFLASSLENLITSLRDLMTKSTFLSLADPDKNTFDQKEELKELLDLTTLEKRELKNLKIYNDNINKLISIALKILLSLSNE